MGNLRRWVGSGVGLWIILLEPIIEGFVPKSIFEMLGIASLPDELHKWWTGAMWSVDHLRLWLPIALGLAVICWANWRDITIRIHSSTSRWLAVVGLVVGSFIISGLLPEVVAGTPSNERFAQTGTPGGLVAPNNSGIITQGQTGDIIVTQKPLQRVLNEADEQKILSMLPENTKIIDVGDNKLDVETITLANQIREFLRLKGFEVRNSSRIYGGMPPKGVFISPSLGPNGVEQITVGIDQSQ